MSKQNGAGADWSDGRCRRATTHVKRSYGVIALRAGGRGASQMQVVMVRRKETIAMCELLHGSTALSVPLLQKLSSGLTGHERRLVLCAPFERLYALFLPKDTTGLSRKQTRRINWRRQYIRRRFSDIRSTPAFLAAISSTEHDGAAAVWREPEWEFPKGRRNTKHEPAAECALREFSEETGYDGLSDIELHNPMRVVFVERYRSINRIHYENTYYLGFMRSDAPPVFDPQSNQNQRHEISAVRWIDLEDVPCMLRSSQKTKLDCLLAVKKYLTRPIFSDDRVQQILARPCNSTKKGGNATALKAEGTAAVSAAVSVAARGVDEATTTTFVDDLRGLP